MQAYDHRGRHRAAASSCWVEARAAGHSRAGWQASPGMVSAVARRHHPQATSEIALADSEARFRLLADRATDIIVKLDAAGTILYISPACRLLGYAADEMIGRPAVEFIHPADHALTAERTLKLLAGVPREPGERREYRALKKGGGCLWLEGASSVNRDAQGPGRRRGFPPARCHRALRDGGGARPQARRGRGCDARQVRVPGQHEPRDPHASDRHPRVRGFAGRSA